MIRLKQSISRPESSTGIDAAAMVYKLSSGRRYLNGELVEPPQLGTWVVDDLFPWLDAKDFIDAGLYDIEADADEWAEIEDWLLEIQQSDAPLLWLIERCLDNGELLPIQMIETRLKDCSQDWISACMSAINAAPTAFASEVLGVVSFAVRVERNGRATKPQREAEPERRSTLTFFRPG